MTVHEEKARENFMAGCNCSQAVMTAFGDLTGLDERLARRLSSSFGGGFGRLREVCGAACGMFLAAGCLYGYDDVDDRSVKAKHYTRVQELAKAFREENGALRCADLLHRDGAEPPTPTVRDAAFYQTRPCLRCVQSAARILDEYIERNPIP